MIAAMHMLVQALPGADRLAADLAGALGCEWGALEVHTFPDGECLPRIRVPVQGRHVVLAGSLDQPDRKTLALLFAADAARELGACQVGLVAPYLAYMRQDDRFQPGEALTSRSYARLLSASLDYLVTVDPHLHRWHALDALYPIPTQVVPSAPAIAAWLQQNVARPWLVGPDEESAQWVRHVAGLAGAPWAVMQKVRHGDSHVQVQPPPDAGRASGCTPVLLDDIVSTGSTMAAAAVSLRGAGQAAPVCIAVHALFTPGTVTRLRESGVRQVVSCDTVPHRTNRIALGSRLADAVRELAHAGKEGAR